MAKLSDHVPNIKAALDASLAEHLAVSQGKLAKDAPKDTGRFASSWFIGKDNPNRNTRPEGWGAPGSAIVASEPFNGKIEFNGTWYISNNLPYAERVCYDPKWSKGGAGGADWFTRISNQMPNDLNARIERRLPK